HTPKRHRAGDHIDDTIGRRNQRMQAYNVARMAIISLKGSSDLPPMTEADLFMKSVQRKRHVGDSGRPDGLLWRATALQSNDGDESADDGFQISSVTGTQMDKRRSGPMPKRKSGEIQKQPERPEGWLWHLGKLTKMSDEEMDAWSSEGVNQFVPY
ncbi:hypothetical protein B0H10DRAFT_2117778, partial [Mycena sp. CBHHK59/15]